MKQSMAAKITKAILVIIILAIFTSPFILMFLASFKTQSQIMSADNLFNFTPTLKNFVTVFQEHSFFKYMLNSFIVATGAVGFALLIGLPASYAIAKYQLQGLGVVILIVKIIPGIMFLVPWFMLYSNMGLVDTYTGLILSHMLIALPYIVWIMIPFFESLPREIQEAGLIDGCTNVQVFTRIVLPVAAPGYMTCSLLAFIHSWNNFMFSLTLSGNDTKTLPVAMFNFMSYAQIDWGAIMAAATIIVLPVMLLALLTQKYIVSGLSAGAVKG
ncbi:carbohydrate ABC transporter permease [Radiobacillus sp. PE A8.2]|uniref:carbohydrate ABC transporter permease n=1 Tax=Radiobacillus sp. PE A8.2 TaxID=3380349 RepID=UPI00388D665C